MCHVVIHPCCHVNKAVLAHSTHLHAPCCMSAACLAARSFCLLTHPFKKRKKLLLLSTYHRHAHSLHQSLCCSSRLAPACLLFLTRVTLGAVITWAWWCCVGGTLYNIVVCSLFLLVVRWYNYGIFLAFVLWKGRSKLSYSDGIWSIISHSPKCES